MREIEEIIARAVGANYEGYVDPVDTPNRWASATSAAAEIVAALDAAGYTVVPMADYLRLYEGAESDDTLMSCDSCGAWIDHEDPARCTGDDYSGCWKAIIGKGLCRHERGEILERARQLAARPK